MNWSNFVKRSGINESELLIISVSKASNALLWRIQSYVFGWIRILNKIS